MRVHVVDSILAVVVANALSTVAMWGRDALHPMVLANVFGSFPLLMTVILHTTKSVAFDAGVLVTVFNVALFAICLESVTWAVNAAFYHIQPLQRFTLLFRRQKDVSPCVYMNRTCIHAMCAYLPLVVNFQLLEDDELNLFDMCASVVLFNVLTFNECKPFGRVAMHLQDVRYNWGLLGFADKYLGTAQRTPITHL